MVEAGGRCGEFCRVEGAGAEVPRLADDRIGLRADDDGECRGLLLVAEGRHHRDRGVSGVVVPLDLDLLCSLSVYDASGCRRANAPGELLSIRSTGGTEDVGLDLIGACRVMVQAEWRDRRQGIEFNRGGGSAEWGGGPIGAEEELMVGGRAVPIDRGVGAEVVGQGPLAGRHAPAVVDAGFNRVHEVQEVFSRASFFRTADDRVRRVDDHDGHGDVRVAVVGTGVGGGDGVDPSRGEGDGVECPGSRSDARRTHLPVDRDRGIGGEGETLPGASCGGGGDEAQFGQDVDREVAFT